MNLLTRSRLRIRPPKEWAALLLCLLILVGAGMALPPLVKSASDSTTGCEALLNPKISLPLPVLRERLETNYPTQDNQGGAALEWVERLSFRRVGTDDLFSVPPGSAVVIENPPYPYQYKEACWGQSHLSIRVDNERSRIMLPQKHPFLERRQDLVVKAQLPRPRVEGNPPFKAGEEVQISLSEPPTTENNIGSNSTPATPFTWSLDDSSASLTEEGILKRSAVLTLPNADTKTEGRVIISFNEERVGQISFKRVGKDWSVEAEPQPSSRYYVREGLQMSSRRLSLLLATLAALLAYLAIARCAYSFCVKTTAEQPPVNKTVSRVPARLRALQWLRSRRWGLYLKCINPVVVTAGPYGKASLSKLQLLWFTLLVMSVLVYLLCLTGDLSDLPSSVLMLLGISAAGTVGSSLSVNTRRRLSFVNWQWLNDQEWLVECQKYGGKDAKKKQADTYGNQSRWRDLLLDEEGGVNVYKFQLLFSSVLVGIFLLLSGGSNLRGFRLPENFPQLLGISNFFYVFGRSVEPTGFEDLNKEITQLIEAEKDLKSSSSNLSKHQQDLDNYLLIARRAAGMTKVAFSDLAKTKFEDTRSRIPDKDLLPLWAPKDWADSQLPSQPATPPP